MGKISPVSSKYIVHANIDIEGVVDRPDVIGAIFGQTEGLLGSDLELRELQRSGRIGRIEVNVETRSGKTHGKIVIPSSLDMAETSIVGAALEIIQRIGPCDARIKVLNIEDVRVSKRKFVVERAKELLKRMKDSVMPDSQELADEVAYSVRVSEILEYGKDRLPAGPSVDESDEVIVVEGRADVLNLLKHGIKNCIALNGATVPQTIIDLSKRKILSVFVDGDRGGDLIVEALLGLAEIDFVTKAPDGKEVEEITKKEIHKALRSKVAVEQAKMEMQRNSSKTHSRAKVAPRSTASTARSQRGASRAPPRQQRYNNKAPAERRAPARPAAATISAEEKGKFKNMLEDLIGTRGAYVLDRKLNILGKVPIAELVATIKSMASSSEVYAVVFDGVADKELIDVAEQSGIRSIVGMDTKVKPSGSKLMVLTAANL